MSLKSELQDILEVYGNYCVESVLLVPTDVSNRKIDKVQATDRILNLLDKSLPPLLNEDGSSGKWVNGWNDAIEAVRKVIKEEL